MEGREIIAEHQEIDAAVCSSAFAFGVHPSARRVSFFSWACASRRLRRFFLRQPRTFFHTLPPLVECRALSCNCPISNRFHKVPH
jgi:hypothetical protein